MLDFYYSTSDFKHTHTTEPSSLQPAEPIAERASDPTKKSCQEHELSISAQMHQRPIETDRKGCPAQGIVSGLLKATSTHVVVTDPDKQLSKE